MGETVRDVAPGASADAAAPVLLVVSDALGDTACEVALAAAGQFDEGAARIARLPKVTSADEVGRRVRADRAAVGRVAVLHTIASPRLRAEVAGLLEGLGVPAVDLLGPAVGALSALTGAEPKGVAGTIHRTDERYFRRIEAMEYAVAHDDGRGADDLAGADIVLVGVSRTSKTPLSLYLAFQGYRVANVPLASGMEPPPALMRVDPARVFGLLSTAAVLCGIRDRRLGDDLARAWAGSYADPAAVEREMEEAAALMRRIGCFVIRTDGKAVEESAAEIVAHLDEVAAARAAR